MLGAIRDQKPGIVRISDTRCTYLTMSIFCFRKNYFDKDPREADEDVHKSGFSNQDKEM